LNLDLEQLCRHSTPTVANAIELLGLRSRTEGFFRPGLQCLLPEARSIAGYAVTCTISTAAPDSLGKLESWDYWDHICQIAGPRIALVQDIDPEPGLGSFWGEVNSNIHKALGCVGAVTNGGARDLDEMQRLGFQMLYAQACVSHAYVHITSAGQPVRFLGLAVMPGDLVMADKHGAMVIPPAAAAHLEEAIAEMERRERPVIEYCQSSAFKPEELRRVVEMHLRKPSPWAS
jgi:4-hydroxy-4-methyl-2-oxoglutarate aldolase